MVASRNEVLWSAVIALAMLGCDQRVEPYVPGEEPSQPDLSRIFPPESALPPPTGEAPPPPPGGARPPAVAAAPIRGRIEIAPELAERAASSRVVFLIARAPGGGPPVAARRLEPRFPLEFELGPDDRMIQSRPFEGPLLLSARLDGDGNATTRSPGDVQGAAPEPVHPGDTGVRLLLDEPL